MSTPGCGPCASGISHPATTPDTGGPLYNKRSPQVLCQANISPRARRLADTACLSRWHPTRQSCQAPTRQGTLGGAGIDITCTRPPAAAAPQQMTQAENNGKRHPCCLRKAAAYPSHMCHKASATSELAASHRAGSSQPRGANPVVLALQGRRQRLNSSHAWVHPRRLWAMGWDPMLHTWAQPTSKRPRREPAAGPAPPPAEHLRDGCGAACSQGVKG
jgi:hypothetical protein